MIVGRHGLGNGVELSAYSWMELAEMIDRFPAVIVPVGSTEQHGAHLPICTDTFLVTEIAKEAARLSSKALVAPPVSYGYTPYNMNRTGTVTVELETLIRLLSDVTVSLVHHGFKRILIVNGHGGNRQALAVAAAHARDRMPSGEYLIAQTSYFDLAAREIDSLRASGPGGICHACELETSLMMYLAPSSVRVDKIVSALPSRHALRPETSLDLTARPPVLLFSPINRRAPDTAGHGAVGDPTLATAEKGQAFFEAIVNRLAKFVEDFVTLY